ncbi:PREDICTED: monocarboxylate transporter 6 [Condylura cristata]|uniref:monocarboxylate transporter 6 n=1 Tax=Condylura cristata TaxID=143302 RepID=UPI000643A93F|nr:PREDICTED: monocarboxylate transporter 6 [Condylura cristata]XP_012588425.1 PREDICTED: monocarboxylate transporter 6 [Condylura cristata]XP_012588426.1 PREDICTED: monocarboxylate transporter 6 [Condylura cristata]XP_012588427.1 PREDICTED: monocarboxylate transporter 6 [Condylura cristata]
MAQALERPEGSWAWVVLLSSMVTQGLTLGFPTCAGIFFTELQREFQASNSETSWFPSILTAMVHAGGPLCSILVDHFGCRVTVMLGGAMACLGMVASSFCRTLSELYITAGFITGLGLCFSFQSSITVLGFYFHRRRPLANALASVGVSLGITLWPLLSRYLLEDLGWRGTFLIFGGVFLHCCVCGALLRPVATRVAAAKTSDVPHLPSKTPAPGCLAACGQTIQRHLAFDILLHNTGYRVYTLGVVWMILGFPLPHVFLVPYAMRHGVDEHKAALLISIIGFSNIFLRPLAGLLAGRPRLASHRKYLFTLATLLNGLTNLVCTMSADFRVLVGYCLVYSVSMSGVGALLFQVLMDLVPMDRFSSALGLFTVLESISILISPPLAGFLLDTTHNFSYVFYMSSFFLISAALFMGGSFCVLQKKESQGKPAEAEAASRGLPPQGTDSSEKRLCVEAASVTSV